MTTGTFNAIARRMAHAENTGQIAAAETAARDMHAFLEKHPANRSYFEQAIQTGSRQLVEMLLHHHGADPYRNADGEAPLFRHGLAYHMMLQDRDFAMLHLLRDHHILDSKDAYAIITEAACADCAALFTFGKNLVGTETPLFEWMPARPVIEKCGPGLAPHVADALRAVRPETIIAHLSDLPVRTARAIALAHPDTPIHLRDTMPLDPEVRAIITATHSAHGRIMNASDPDALLALLSERAPSPHPEQVS